MFATVYLPRFNNALADIQDSASPQLFLQGNRRSGYPNEDHLYVMLSIRPVPLTFKARIANRNACMPLRNYLSLVNNFVSYVWPL